MKKRNVIKLLGLTLLAGASTGALTGCSSELKELQSVLNKTIHEKINTPEYLAESGISKIDKYVFLAAEFNKEAITCTVELNGIAKFDSNKEGYVNVELSIDNNELDNVNNKTRKEDILNILTNNIKKHDFEKLEILPVENIKKLNNAVSKSTTGPIDDFKYHKGMVYGLSAPVINYEEGYAMFETKTYMEYVKTEVTPTYGIVGVDDKGVPKWGMIMVTKTLYEDYDQKNNVYIAASKTELEKMETDPMLVYSGLVNLFDNKKQDDFVIDSISVEKIKDMSVTENNININMHKTTSLNL